MRIEVKSDIQKLSARLKWYQRDQIPFAASLAINQVAADVADEITRQMDMKLDRPTPFTKKAFQVRPGTFRGKRSNKQNLTAVVEAAQIQADYLRFQIDGGIRHPKQRAILVPSNKAPKNQYGNLSRANRKRFVDGKGKYLPLGLREKRTPGIYLRDSRENIEPMAFYVQQARYKGVLPTEKIAAGIVRSRFPKRLQAALQRALATAR